MQINMNKQTVRELRDQLQVILDKHAPMQSSMLADLDIQIGNASFVDTEVTFKLSVKVKGSKPKEERDLEDYLSMFGTRWDKDRIVNYSAHNNNMDLKLVGYKRANRKYPFILQDVKTLKRYKFPTDWVNANFSIEEMVS
tara:strand:+ start:53 stop:472 length:420 start_codon:yes stop_codon:yes gene_type:complete